MSSVGTLFTAGLQTVLDPLHHHMSQSTPVMENPNPSGTLDSTRVSVGTATSDEEASVTGTPSRTGGADKAVTSFDNSLTVRKISLDCFESFKRLLDTITEAPESDGYQEILLSLHDEFGRLHVWTGEVGAFETGSNSLVGKLRGPADVAQQVVRVLTELKELLEEGSYSPI
jgi:hypothetical protein